MAKLVSIDTVLSRYNLTDNEGVRARVGQALDAGTLRLEMRLPTAFARNALNADRFYIDVNQRPLIDGGFTLMSRNGYVDAAQAITALWCESVDLLATEGEPLAIRLQDPILGRFFVESKDLPGGNNQFFLGLSYTSGFVLKTSTGVYQNVPEQLQELGIVASMGALTDLTPCAKDQQHSNAKLDDLIVPYKRYRASAYTVIV